MAEHVAAETTARLLRCDDTQGEAARHLANMLAMQRFDRFNPFRAFGLPSPYALTRQPHLDEAHSAT